MKSDNKQFSVLAQYYDILNYNADYKKVADYIEDVFIIYGKSPELVLDLACGTGSLTVELDKRGYDMIGLDSSPEMLSVAYAQKPNILWINQDMCGFELYGTVDAVVCCFDSLNYILDEEKIDKCFGLVRNYLNPGGLFIFDVNSKYKFENIYANNDIVLENSGVFCSWQNSY
ncbi:MAG: class I SAM-dependent methyltransferase, partial [Oscillospiraceae bacterium]|nr:class I SAM-dependent methyltransferase [Oscillospiraceae bacterium]